MIPKELQDMIEQLCQYLRLNGKVEDGKRIEEIGELLKKGSKADIVIGLKRLSAMCSVKYLGDLNIKEFDNPNDWWNFLSGISKLSNQVLNKEKR